MDDYKGFIVFGNDDKEGRYQDGETVMFGNIKSEDLHIVNLLDIANTYFKDNSIFSKLTIRHQPEIVSYFLVDLGNIIFLNNTEYSKNGMCKHGKIGMIMLPETITEKQLDALKGYANNLEAYDLIIKTDLKLKEGFLESRTLACMDKMDAETLIKTIKNNCGFMGDSPLKH